MKIIHIEKTKSVRKTKKEIEQEAKKRNSNVISWYGEFKTIPLKEPIYIVEMSFEEIQLVSFYLELEKRQPIIDVKIKKD